jgi:hypothetical protein
VENKSEQLINNYHLLATYHVSDMLMDYLVQFSQQHFTVDIIGPFLDKGTGLKKPAHSSKIT